MKIFESPSHFSLPSLRLKIEHFPYDAQDMAPALLRWEKFFNMVGEQDEPDLVMVANRAPGQNGAQFRGDFSLQAQHAAELPRGTQIHEQHDRQLAFLHITLD